MRHASTTLKKIFTEILRREVGGEAPLLAWPLACGAKVAEKTSAVGYVDGVLTVEVPDEAWQQQLQGLTNHYLAALEPISTQPVNTIEFVAKGRLERRSR